MVFLPLPTRMQFAQGSLPAYALAQQVVRHLREKSRKDSKSSAPIVPFSLVPVLL